MMPKRQVNKKLLTDDHQELANRKVREWRHLAGNRGNWETQWEQAAQIALPAYRNTFNADNIRQPGTDWGQFQYDSTIAVAAERFSAIVSSLITPALERWFSLSAGNPIAKADRNTKLWFEQVVDIVFEYLYSPASNWEGQNQQVFLSLGVFGTGPMFIDQLYKRPGVRFKALSLAESYPRENHQGQIDAFDRCFWLTARQARQMFGEENIPEQIYNALDTNPEALFRFLHVVEPQEDVDPRRLDYKGMPYSSLYISVEQCQLITAPGGYQSFPYPVSRYSTTPGEIYGRGPMLNSLNAAKCLNEMKKTMLKQGQRITDPPLFAPDDGVLDGADFTPGALNYGGVNQSGQMLIHTLPTGNLAAGKDAMEWERSVINDAFLVTIFQILVESPQMTATEVLERAKEKGILLAPTIGRQTSEYLGPVIDRVLSVLAMQRLLPPMPRLLAQTGGAYKVRYDSPLTRAQLSGEAAGLQRTVQPLLEMVKLTGDPTPLDHFNWDAIVPEVATTINAVPTRWLLDAQSVAQIRQGRAEQAQAKQMAEAAPGAAALTNAGASMASAQAEAAKPPPGGGTGAGPAQ